MSVPCLSQTSTVSLFIDPGTGHLAANVRFHPTGGLYDSGNGIAILGINSVGLYTAIDGAVVPRQSFAYAGDDTSAPVGAGSLVGAGAYVQVGPALGVNYQRLGRFNQWIRVDMSVECAVAAVFPDSVTTFDGWDVQIERSIDFGAWQEMAREGVNGLKGSIRHRLMASNEVLIGDDAVHNMQMRLTARGGLAGVANVQSYSKMYIKARGC